ncbi:hypothetical protein EYF80_045348 [Liparis tanakae]|uniref:Uncharacterized protein n=1 Tax=Liparis tanakae TaxID=230148 RepID=A0A4Z2FU96_9TELE|nr:hypothetical protein EYF80_045348 [Liparis tanakae]
MKDLLPLFMSSPSVGRRVSDERASVCRRASRRISFPSAVFLFLRLLGSAWDRIAETKDL